MYVCTYACMYEYMYECRLKKFQTEIMEITTGLFGAMRISKCEVLFLYHQIVTKSKVHNISHSVTDSMHL
jgi:hypothetical protein